MTDTSGIVRSERPYPPQEAREHVIHETPVRTGSPGGRPRHRRPAAGNLAAAAVGQAPPKLSQWAGVQVGLNVPYSLGTGNNIAAEDLLKRVVEVGVGSLELRAQPVEHFLGSPTVRAAARPRRRARRPARRAAAPTPQQMAQGGRSGRTQTPEQVGRAAEGRGAVVAPVGAVSKLKELRQMYEKAGVAIDILKVDDLYAISDEELDYFFQMARDLGARAVSAELPQTRSDTKRIGAFADKHKVFMAYHHHAQAGGGDLRGDLHRGPVQRRQHRHRPLDGHAERVTAALHRQARTIAFPTST